MKRHTGMLLVLTCLALTRSPKGMAHEVPYSGVQRTVVVHDSYSAGKYRGTRPHWLQTHAHFHDWYLHSPYRHVRHVSWLQLYDLYGMEVRYHRPVRHYYVRDYVRDARHDDRKYTHKTHGRFKQDRYKRKRGHQ
jgi:hypothetical protein